MGSSELTESTHQANIHFPLAFNLYYKRSWGLAFHLGEHKSQALYAAALPSGWYGELILYSGPNTDSCPRLATVKDGGKLGALDSLISITLPLGSGLQEKREMEMRVHGSLRSSEAYEFAVPIPFEWRRAHGDELRSLGESSRGWKSVRLSSAEEDRKEEEVVAVWADASMLGMSMTKAARFQFPGSAATGELGELWTLMAVVTFLRVWQRKMQLTITAGTAAAVA